MNSTCHHVRGLFSEYLDGAISGTEMHEIADHLSRCTGCTTDFAQWRAMQQALATLGPAKPPADLALRLRVALSREAAKSRITWMDRLELAWQNTLAPFALQASAGLASALLLIGTVVLLGGIVTVPEQAMANDDLSGAFTAPHLLYTSPAASALDSDGQPVLVEAYVNAAGQIYDYRIVSGADSAQLRAQLQNKLLFSQFEPARLFGSATRGRVILSYAGVQVKG